MRFSLSSLAVLGSNILPSTRTHALTHTFKCVSIQNNSYCCSPYRLVFMMLEATNTAEASVNCYQTARRNNQTTAIFTLAATKSELSPGATSCVDCLLLGYETVQHSRWLPTCGRYIGLSSSWYHEAVPFCATMMTFNLEFHTLLICYLLLINYELSQKCIKSRLGSSI